MSVETANAEFRAELLEAWATAIDKDLTTVEEFLGCLTIESKEMEEIPFDLKPPQRRLVQGMQAAWDRGEAYFAMILKARQIGFSTLCQAIQAEGVLRWPGLHGMTFCYETEVVQELFTKVDHFIEQVPKEVRAQTRLASKNNIAMRHHSESGYQESRLGVKTAKNTKGGRGWTLHRVHLSEPAFYDNLKVLLGLLQAVPNKPGCCVILEFTANGHGNVKPMWDRANLPKDHPNYLAYDCIFVSWLEEEAYALDLNPGERKKMERTLDTDEKLYRRKYNASWEQLKWRRWAIRHLCDNHIPSFKQEYPTFPAEAFQSTGRPVFNVPNLASWLPLAEEQWAASKQSTLIDAGSERVVCEETSGGMWTVKEEPREGRLYCWAIDSAEGIEKGEGMQKAGDATCIGIVDAETGVQVAEYHGRMDLDVAADECRKGSILYGMAWGHVELPNQGYAILTALKMMNYGRVLYRTRIEPSAEGDPSPEIRPGFMMNGKSKPIVIARLVSMIRSMGLLEEWEAPVDSDGKIVKGHDKPICPFSPEVIREMLTYERNAMGKLGASGQNFDDRVMMMALLHQAVEDSYDVSDRTRVRGIHTMALLMAGDPDLDDEEWHDANEESQIWNRKVEELWNAQTF